MRCPATTFECLSCKGRCVLAPEAPHLTLSPVDDFPPRWGDELGPDAEPHPAALMLGRVLVIAAVLIPVALIAARLAGWV